MKLRISLQNNLGITILRSIYYQDDDKLEFQSSYNLMKSHWNDLHLLTLRND